MNHTQKEIKKSRNITSSPMPAIMEATREEGNGGCGRGLKA